MDSKISGAEELLTSRELAALLKVDPKTARRWDVSGQLPAAVRTPGGHRRWRRSDVEPFLNPGQRS